MRTSEADGVALSKGRYRLAPEVTEEATVGEQVASQGSCGEEEELVAGTELTLTDEAAGRPSFASGGWKVNKDALS